MVPEAGFKSRGFSNFYHHLPKLVMIVTYGSLFTRALGSEVSVISSINWFEVWVYFCPSKSAAHKFVEILKWIKCQLFLLSLIGILIYFSRGFSNSSLLKTLEVQNQIQPRVMFILTGRGSLGDCFPLPAVPPVDCFPLPAVPPGGTPRAVPTGDSKSSAVQCWALIKMQAMIAKNFIVLGQLPFDNCWFLSLLRVFLFELPFNTCDI